MHPRNSWVVGPQFGVEDTPFFPPKKYFFDHLCQHNSFWFWVAQECITNYINAVISLSESYFIKYCSYRIPKEHLDISGWPGSPRNISGRHQTRGSTHTNIVYDRLFRT